MAFKKDKFAVKVSDSMTIKELKSHLEPLSGVPAGNQKLMYKSMLDDNKTVGACALKVSAAPKIINYRCCCPRARLSVHPTVFIIGTIATLFADSEIGWGCFPKSFGLLFLTISDWICAGLDFIFFGRLASR